MSVVPFESNIRLSHRLKEFERHARFDDFDRAANRFERNFDRATAIFDRNFDRRSSSVDSILGSLTKHRLVDKPRAMFGSPLNMMMRDPFSEDPFFSGPVVPSFMGGRSGMESFMSPFSNLMAASMGDMTQDGGNCHSFSSSSVMTMTTGPDGRPQVYQASSSSRSAPGGVKETRRTIADSRTGVRKMAVGHHLDERSHVIEKEVSGDGELEERQEFVNLDESEAPTFDAEFRRRAGQGYGRSIDYRSRARDTGASPTHARSTYLPALPSSSNSRRRQRPMLAISPSTSRHEERRQKDRANRHHRNN